MKPRKSSSHRRLLFLQKRIFRALEAEADLLLGEMPPTIQRYERECRADFRIPAWGARRSSRKEMVEAIRRSDVSLVADYHTFYQAQRTALRLMKDSVLPGERWFVGLEFVPSRFQAELDAFQEGKLDLESFHRAINYERDWGFPWKNYAPIFEWANEAGVRLIALNRPRELVLTRTHDKASDSELHERDRWAAGIITDLLAQENRNSRKKARMIALYGELHVADRHLPHQLRSVSREFLGKALEVVCVHQNVDSIYWQLARKQREHLWDVMRLRKGVFHVVSGTPWSKLQSLVSWAEGGAFAFPGAVKSTLFAEESLWSMTTDSGSSVPGGTVLEHLEDELLSEMETDYLTLIGQYQESIAEFLGIDPAPLEALSVQTIHGADFVEGLRKDPRFSSREIALIRDQVGRNQRIYVPRVNIAYLGAPSHNAAAEMAAIHLLRAKMRSQAILEKDVDDYYRLVIEAAFGFFGSLILNPRRKCDLPEDHERRILQLQRMRRDRELNLELKSRQWALQGWAREQRGVSRPAFLTPRMMLSSTSPALLMSAKFLGQMLGKRLHRAILNETVSVEMVRYLCLARAEGARRLFQDRYRELVLLVQGEVLDPSKTHSI